MGKDADVTQLPELFSVSTKIDRHPLNMIASDMADAELCEYASKARIEPFVEVLYPAPDFLLRTLEQFNLANYDNKSEATCRIPTDMFLIATQAHYQENHKKQKTRLLPSQSSLC